MDLVDLRYFGLPMLALGGWLLYKRIPKTPRQKQFTYALLSLGIYLLLMLPLALRLGPLALLPLPFLGLFFLVAALNYLEELWAYCKSRWWPFSKGTHQ